MSAHTRARDAGRVSQIAARQELAGPTPGKVGKVTGGTVTASVQTWGPQDVWGPVPWAAATNLSPEPDDTCVLVPDAAGQALYALVWGSGDPIT